MNRISWIPAAGGPRGCLRSSAKEGSMPAFAQTQKRKPPVSAARVTAVRRDLRLARTLASQKLQPTIAQKLPPSILPESSALVSKVSAARLGGWDFTRVPARVGPLPGIHPKLRISAPGDAYEQEADRVSEQVMRMPGGRLQRRCA